MKSGITNEDSYFPLKMNFVCGDKQTNRHTNFSKISVLNQKPLVPSGNKPLYRVAILFHIWLIAAQDCLLQYKSSLDTFPYLFKKDIEVSANRYQLTTSHCRHTNLSSQKYFLEQKCDHVLIFGVNFRKSSFLLFVRRLDSLLDHFELKVPLFLKLTTNKRVLLVLQNQCNSHMLSKASCTGKIN